MEVRWREGGGAFSCMAVTASVPMSLRTSTQRSDCFALFVSFSCGRAEGHGNGGKQRREVTEYIKYFKYFITVPKQNFQGFSFLMTFNFYSLHVDTNTRSGKKKHACKLCV